MAEASVVAVLVFVLMYAYSRMVPRKSRWRGDLPYGTGQTPFIFNADTSADNAPVLGEDGTKVIGKVMGQPWTQGMENEYLQAIRTWGSGPFASVVPISTREEWLTRGLMQSAPIDPNAVNRMF